MFLFSPKREIVNRNYDALNAGFAPLPAIPKLQGENKEVCWTIGLFKDVCAIFSAIFLSSVGYGILMVLIALKLEKHVQNEFLMSVSAVTQIGAGVVFARFLPSVGNKLGLIQSIYLGTSISAVCALLLFFYPGYILWLIVIFFLGISLFITGVSRGTAMINIAPPRIRAFIISFGTMLVAFGNSFGPIVLEVTKTGEKFESFAIACTFLLLSMASLRRLQRIDFGIREEKKISLWRYMKNSPKIMFASFSVNYAISSANTFVIIYGIKIGMLKDNASLLLSSLLFGTLFSIPIGYLADIFNRRMIMILSSILACICSYALWQNHDLQKIHVLLFLMFGCMAGIKLPALVLINEKYKPTQRLAVNSAFSRMGLIGNICGLFATGSMMKNFGAQGLWLSILMIIFLFLVFCCFDYTRKFIKKEYKLSDFSFFNKLKNNEQLSEV